MLNTNEKFKNVPSEVNDHLENSSEDEDLKKIQDILDSTARPTDFDTWTVQEQRDWAYQNIVKYFPNVPETLQNLIPGMLRLVESDRYQEKLPEWIDIDKYHKGQKFVRKHYFSIIISIVFGAIYGYTFSDGLKPIIIAGNSHTPYLAFKRYLNTLKRMLAWCDGEPWVKGTKAYREMQIVRRKHLMIGQKVSQMNYKQYHSASKFANPWCPEYKLLLKDFTMICPSEKPTHRPYKIYENFYKPETINNMTMAIGQANFLLLPILYPQNIGIHDVIDEDLEGFCHMWKCYGYFFGLEDEYNFCHGSLEEIKQRLSDLTQHWTLVNFTDIEPEFVHVTKCIIESITYYPLLYFPYKMMVLLCMKMLNLNMPNLYASLNYAEWIVYKIARFLLCHMFKFSGMRSLFNWTIYKIIEASLNFDPEKLVKLHEKSKQEVPDFLINL